MVPAHRPAEGAKTGAVSHSNWILYSKGGSTMNLDDFTRGYIECALWAETCHYEEDQTDDRSFQDHGYDETDLAPESFAKIIEDCTDFQEANAADLELYCQEYQSRHDYTSEACAGHDFWLTRNGHGAGFWDRGLGELGERLTRAAKVYGSVDLYLGDDGLIYCQ